tara:strand:+ start:27 stop:803 length:777 start_codon:yes stop_codon:yes gene_type:complete
MIKFFRKIRKNLLSEGKTGKYLKYAIGEIVLVVIGILIALQINNWNENRKVQKQEVQIYKEIKSDLIETKKEILKAVSVNKFCLTSNQNLINAILTKEPNSETINNHFIASMAEQKVFPKTSAFENLKTIGLNTLSNDSLRIAITNLFQLSFERMKDQSRMENQDYNISKILFPFQTKYLKPDKGKIMQYPTKFADTLSVPKLIINNYDNFVNDEILLQTLQITLFNRSNIINSEMEVLQEINAVTKNIEVELETLNK